MPKLSYISLSCFFVESIAKRVKKKLAELLWLGKTMQGLSRVGKAGCGIRSRINPIDFGLITDDSVGPPEIKAH